MTSIKSDTNRCVLSGSRQQLSVGDECERRTRCPGPNGCGRLLHVRPTRRDGNPVATLPQHLVPLEKRR